MSHPIVAVVDDDDIVRKALLRLLRTANLKPLGFASAREFLRALEHTHVDCLLLDLQMPEMTGADLLSYLRTSRPELKMPVLIITAHDEPGIRERCLAAGAAAYLTKPLDATILLAEVAKAIPALRVLSDAAD
jgi:FixJ family two-component response regulator